MAEHETIADIAAEKRRIAKEVRDYASDGDYWDKKKANEDAELLEEEADRLEAAWKRERCAIEADALATGAIVEAARKREAKALKSWAKGEAEENFRDCGELMTGNAAKLREALGYISQYADCAASRQHDAHTQHFIRQIRGWAQAALKLEKATTEKSSVVDTKFELCNYPEQVLKIGRDFQNKDGFRGAHYDTVKLLCDTIEYQQEQLKTETEVGNAAKLREALDEILEKIDKWRTDGTMEHWQYSQLFDIADAALAVPPRNCDVGTAEK